MRFVFSLFMLLATICATTNALPSGSGQACDSSAIAIHTRAGATANTAVSVASATVAPGASTTITVTNTKTGFFGFLLYVTSSAAAGVGGHTGAFAAAPALARFCVTQANTPASSTLCHTGTTKQTTMTATWTAPAGAVPGTTYQVVATVAEQGTGTPPLFDVPVAQITIAAAQQAATQAPTQPPTTPPTTRAPTSSTTTTKPTTGTTTTTTHTTTAPTSSTASTATPTTAVTVTTAAPTTATTTTTTTAPTTAVQQAFTMVIVKLKAVLNGTGTVAQLKAAIQNLIAQIQAAIQQAKAAKGVANPNAPVQMIVTKAPTSTGIAAAAATAGSSYQIGFANPADAAMFATLVTDASSTDATTRSQSTLTTSGDLASQIVADPTAVNATGQVQVVDAQQVATVTCPDGTVISQDLQAVMCPATTVAPASAGAGTAAATNPISNKAFIGLIIGGVVLLFVVVGGFVYYQKSKSTTKKTTVAPRV